MGLLAVQGTFKSLLQHHSLKTSVLWLLDFFMVQFSHPYMTIGKTITLTRWTFVDKVMCLLLNMLPRFVIAFLPRSKGLFNSIAFTIQAFVSKVMSLLLNMLSRFVIAFLPRSNHLNFMAAVNVHSYFGAQENKVCHCFHCFLIYVP